MATREDHCSFLRFDLVSVRYRSRDSIRVVWMVRHRALQNIWTVLKGCDLLQVLLLFFMQEFSLIEIIVSEIYLSLLNSIICLICTNQNQER